MDVSRRKLTDMNWGRGQGLLGNFQNFRTDRGGDDRGESCSDGRLGHGFGTVDQFEKGFDVVDGSV